MQGFQTSGPSFQLAGLWYSPGNPKNVQASCTDGVESPRYKLAVRREVHVVVRRIWGCSTMFRVYCAGQAWILMNVGGATRSETQPCNSSLRLHSPKTLNPKPNETVTCIWQAFKPLFAFGGDPLQNTGPNI